MSASKIHPPKDGVRFGPPGLEIRDASEDGMPTLFGYFLRFDEWTLIDSYFEGKFLERIARGAAKKTLEESRDQIRILFNHGCDPSIGEKPLTKPELVEDSNGVRYEGELFDTSYNRDLVPILKADQLGASFKFRIIKESFNEEPEPSEANPNGIPERTIEELKLYEGGPVTFPAYDGASAGVRSGSLTDRIFVEGFKQHPDSHPEEMEGLVRTWVEHDLERATELVASITAIEDADRDSDPEGDEPSRSDEAPEAAKASESPVTEADDDNKPDGEPSAPETVEETDIPGVVEENHADDALSGAEHAHSAGSREAPWRAQSAAQKPPWRRNAKPVSPWHAGEKE